MWRTPLRGCAAPCGAADRAKRSGKGDKEHGPSVTVYESTLRAEACRPGGQPPAPRNPSIAHAGAEYNPPL